MRSRSWPAATKARAFAAIRGKLAANANRERLYHYFGDKAGLLRADKVVLALGSYSPQLLAPVGLRIPVYPVKGYSITVPITDAQYAPAPVHVVFELGVEQKLPTGHGADVTVPAGQYSPLAHVTWVDGVAHLLPAAQAVCDVLPAGQ